MNQDKASGGGAGVETPDQRIAAIERCLEEAAPFCMMPAVDALQEASRLLSSLRASLAQTKPAPEPVAWRLQSKHPLDKGCWMFSQHAKNKEGWEPLYASPIPPKGADPQIDVHLAEATNKGKAP